MFNTRFLLDFITSHRRASSGVGEQMYMSVHLVGGEIIESARVEYALLSLTAMKRASLDSKGGNDGGRVRQRRVRV